MVPIQQAVARYQRAVEQGSEKALVGESSAVSLQSFYGYTAAAQQGNAHAQYALARQLQDGSNNLQHDLLWASAHAGFAAAQFALGERFANGEGLEQDWYLACKWYQMAADQESAEAQCALAGCYLEGLGVNRDMVKAFHFFEKAASQGIARAQWKLGAMYVEGIPGVLADTKQATLLCKRAAQAGFVPAQATLGMLFSLAAKHERAVYWWSKAAEQGDLEAQFNLANTYFKGIGAKNDDARAWELLLSAAESGLPAAQARLGLAYATGKGMVQDLIESAKWFVLAANQGDKSALSNIKRAQHLLSTAQFAEANRRATAWKPVPGIR